MQFLVPTFLIASLAVVIPILIHLFWFRRFKPVYFTNVRFLRELKEETASRSRLRNLLVLATRIGAILSLVMAFAQPFLPKGTASASGPKAVSIYIDNSYSMMAQSRDVSSLDLARQRARKIVEGYSPTDRFQIITNDPSGAGLRLVDREEALGAIDEIRPGPAVTPLSTVMARQRQVLASEPDRTPVSYLLSDFQKHSELSAIRADTGWEVVAIPFPPIRELNVAIDSVWMEEPVWLTRQAGTLLVRLRNYGSEPVEQVRLALREGGQEKPVSVLTIPGRSDVTDTVVFVPQTTGWQDIELFIHDYPIQFDDRYHITFEVKEKLQVLVIREGAPTPFLQKGLEGIHAIEPTLQNWDRLDYDRFGEYQLIVLDNVPEISSGLQTALRAYADQGGNVMIFPPAGKKDLPGYNEALSAFGAPRLEGWEERERQAGNLNTASQLFRDVYTNPDANLRLPLTRGNYRLSKAGAGAREALLTYRDGTSMLVRVPGQQGNLFLSAAPLDPAWSDLGRNGEVFIPMIYRMALAGQPARPMSYTLGAGAEMALTVKELRPSEKPARLRSEQAEFIPGQRMVGTTLRLSVPGDPVKAGVYQVVGEGDLVHGHVALHDDRRESVQEFLTPSDLEEAGFQLPDDMALADLSAWVGEKERGVVLWRWFVILALAFLLAETLLLRLWRP